MAVALAAAAALGFLAGLFFLAALEAAALLLTVRWLRRRATAAPPDAPCPASGDLNGERPLGLPLEKQGYLWVLEPEKAPKISSTGISVGGPKETKNKCNIFEVSPVKKLAKLKERSLRLISLDGSNQSNLDLLNCTVVAVSASSMSSHKWNKRYPIKIESKDSESHTAFKLYYLYADTSWEKESWCKALRLASSSGTEKWIWYSTLVKEFQSYIASLGAEYPNFLKPSKIPTEVMDKTTKPDGLSKARDFLKRLAKKASAKHVIDGKIRSSTNSERKSIEKLWAHHGMPWTDVPCSPDERSFSNKVQDMSHLTSLDAYSNYGHSEFSTQISDESTAVDEGTLCLNLLFSRLFFDTKMSSEVSSFIRSHVQRTLSSMRTPSYIGDLNLTGFSFGDLPPHFHKMVVLPGDLNELWALEVDFEYSCGLTLNIETRLEIHAAELQNDIMTTSFETDLIIEDNSDLNEIPENNESQARSEAYKSDGDGLSHSKSFNWRSSYMTRWKAMLHTIADSVSQVPLSLTIHVKSVRGPLRVSVKPPPSDQLWYGFPSMPEINWELQASIGDKISNNHIASLLGTRFKAALGESLVLPNCGCVCIPWMIAEKEDWVPCSAAPFVYRRRESSDAKVLDQHLRPAQEETMKCANNFANEGSVPNATEDAEAETVKSVVHIEASNNIPESSRPSASLTSGACLSSDDSEGLKVALLNADRSEETGNDNEESSPEGSCSTMPLSGLEDQPFVHAEGKRRRPWRRVKMMELGKKMGDKLVEKRRDIEEKSKHIVERMRTRAHEAAARDGRYGGELY